MAAKRRKSPDRRHGRGPGVGPGAASGSSVEGSSVEGSSERSSSSEVRRLDRWLVKRLLEARGRPRVEVVLWDGEPVVRQPGTRVGRVFVKDRRALLAVALQGSLGFGDAFAAGRIEVEGDLAAILTAIYEAATDPSPRPAGGRARRVAPRAKTRHARRDISHHYERGTDFYRSWLGPTMAYTCAYFPSEAASLDQAQIAKMEHVARKLRLRPGEHVIEAGCGWGSLALYLARKHGVTVHAYNISTEQIGYARARARELDLGHRVQFIDDDYHAIRGACDAFVSVGMLEHVGKEAFGELGDIIGRCLAPTGRGLLHSIGRARPRAFDPWIERRIFPGAYIPALEEIVSVVAVQDLAVLDVENLRMHYARTLEEWLAQFEKSLPHNANRLSESFLRAWRLYLAGSIAAFRSGSTQLYQVLFARHRWAGTPWTREHLYAPIDLLDEVG